MGRVVGKFGGGEVAFLSFAFLPGGGGGGGGGRVLWERGGVGKVGKGLFSFLFLCGAFYASDVQLEFSFGV